MLYFRPFSLYNCEPSYLFFRLMMIIQFAFQKLTNSHIKVAKMANKVHFCVFKKFLAAIMHLKRNENPFEYLKSKLDAKIYNHDFDYSKRRNKRCP